MKYKTYRYKKELASLGVSLVLLFVGLFEGIEDRKAEGLQALERPGWGEGEKEYILQAEAEDGKKQELTVMVGEKQYGQEEVTRFLEEAEAYVRKTCLGQNESWERISGALFLPVQIPDIPADLYWELGEEGYFNQEGELLLEQLPPEGGATRITAVILCQGERRDVEIPLKLLPPVWTKEEAWRQSLEKDIQEREQAQQGEERIELPACWEGESVQYYLQEQEETGKGKWLFFSLAAGGALYAALKKEEREKEEHRRRQLLIEYPALVEKLLLLLGAGVSIRNAFFKLCSEGRGKAWQSELEQSVRELKNGEAEGEVYLHFGERLGLLPYIRLGVLLSQNLRSGTGEIMEFLEREMQESFFERREQARQRGEEIEVKLLLPMGLLLILTLGLIMIPAFLQF